MKRTPLILMILAAGMATSAARITKSRPSVSASAPSVTAPSPWAPLAPLVIGSGVEYQSDDEMTEFAFPLSLEYNPTERLGFVIEPEFSTIESKSPDVRSVGGFGDLETAMDYEFVTERRYRPALSAEGRIKWPTASDPDLGEPGRDYSLGLIASKDLVLVELDFNLLYTFIGEAGEEDEIEASLACEWHFNPEFSLIAELVSVSPAGGGNAGIEGTLGLGWDFSDNLRFEQGIVFHEGGELELVFAWEWNFGGD